MDLVPGNSLGITRNNDHAETLMGFLVRFGQTLDNKKIEFPTTNSKGTVILAHDFHRSNERTEHLLLEFLRLTLERTQEKGMRVMTVSELLSSKQ